MYNHSTGSTYISYYNLFADCLVWQAMGDRWVIIVFLTFNWPLLGWLRCLWSVGLPTCNAVYAFPAGSRAIKQDNKWLLGQLGTQKLGLGWTSLEIQLSYVLGELRTASELAVNQPKCECELMSVSWYVNVVRPYGSHKRIPHSPRP